jgi:hypothetical protein
MDGNSVIICVRDTTAVGTRMVSRLAIILAWSSYGKLINETNYHNGIIIAFISCLIAEGWLEVTQRVVGGYTFLCYVHYLGVDVVTKLLNSIQVNPDN